MGYLVVKVCMIGDTCVGKTCIALRYVNNTFNENQLTTLGASFLKKNVETSKGSLYQLQIWDTTGQER